MTRLENVLNGFNKYGLICYINNSPSFFDQTCLPPLTIGIPFI